MGEGVDDVAGGASGFGFTQASSSLLTLFDAARRLGVSERHVRRLRAKGTLRTVTIPGSRSFLVPVEDVAAFVPRRRGPTSRCGREPARPRSGESNAQHLPGLVGRSEEPGSDESAHPSLPAHSAEDDSVDPAQEPDLALPRRRHVWFDAHEARNALIKFALAEAADLGGTITFRRPTSDAREVYRRVKHAVRTAESRLGMGRCDRRTGRGVAVFVVIEEHDRVPHQRPTLHAHVLVGLRGRVDSPRARDALERAAWDSCGNSEFNVLSSDCSAEGWAAYITKDVDLSRDDQTRWRTLGFSRAPARS